MIIAHPSITWLVSSISSVPRVKLRGFGMNGGLMWTVVSGRLSVFLRIRVAVNVQVWLLAFQWGCPTVSTIDTGMLFPAGV